MSKYQVSRFIILCSCSVLVLLSAQGSTQQREPLRKPDSLNRVGVAIGADFLTRSEFLTSETPESITQIEQGVFDPSGEELIGIVGDSGAVFVDNSGNVQKEVTWARDFAARMNIVDIDSDHVPEFMNRGAWVDAASLMDESGKVLWNVPDGNDTDDMAMGDVNGDGKPEFAVGYNGAIGVRLLDVSGEEIWKIPSGNVWHVEMVDTNGDGKDEIIHSGHGLNILDGQGNIISQCPNPASGQEGVYFSHFAVVHWPDSSSALRIIQNGEGVVWIVNLDGSIEKELDAPERARVGQTYATLVRLESGRPEYLAVLVDYNTWNVAVLYVYDNTGKLVYDEVLPWNAPAVAAVKLGNDDTETLMVGSGMTVWKYEVK